MRCAPWCLLSLSLRLAAVHRGTLGHVGSGGRECAGVAKGINGWRGQEGAAQSRQENGANQSIEQSVHHEMRQAGCSCMRSQVASSPLESNGVIH